MFAYTKKVGFFALYAAVIALMACGGGSPVEDTLVGSDVTADLPGDAVTPADLAGRDIADIAVDVVSDASDVTADVADGIQSGAFGSPCEKNEDCDSRFCMPFIFGSVCSVVCTDSCPDPTWTCEAVNLGGLDSVYVCVPPDTSLCKPCIDDSSCQIVEGEDTARCISYGQDASFCATDCTADADGCRVGFTCTEIEVGFSACVKTEGLCPCLDQVLGQSARCSATNDDGTCYGSRMCLKNAGTFEWGACSVVAPAAETCNNKDDDCNGTIDDMGTGPCGTGRCLHQIPVCVAGAAPLCDATTGSIEELCNGIDDNCNSFTDENWTDKGTPCDGADADDCENGVWGCAEDGATLTCEGDISSEAESCNSFDDDCDGFTDEAEELGEITCGLGICNHTVPACLDGADNVCLEFEGALTEDLPDVAGEDTNCDGVDGDASDAIFVDKVTGDDANAGTREAPVKTIQAGLNLAAMVGATQVLISQGVYTGSLTLINGIGIYGQYDKSRNWVRGPSNVTQIRGGTVAVTAQNILDTTVIQGVVITSESASVAGTSSIGIVATDSPGLLIQSVSINAGAGAAGAAGANGSVGQNGSNGSSGNSGCEYECGFPPICVGLCGTCDRPAGGTGGVGPGSTNGGNGGAGGISKEAGMAGAAGSGTGAGSGGAGGANKGDGSVGGNGAAGTQGSVGAAGQSVGTFSASGYLTSSGSDGTVGTNGGGGGGGGSGGGDLPTFFEGNWCATYGSGGGGGGGAGQGGNGGKGGGGGGASVGILLSGAPITVETTLIMTGNGGNGGAGASGGDGGTGGQGGAGGPRGDGDDQGAGAFGGNGGNGGPGGPGGGGGGGVAFGVVCVSATLLGTDTTIVPGSGGFGGASTGNVGNNGATGETRDCF